MNPALSTLPWISDPLLCTAQSPAEIPDQTQVVLLSSHANAQFLSRVAQFRPLRHGPSNRAQDPPGPAPSPPPWSTSQLSTNGSPFSGRRRRQRQHAPQPQRRRSAYAAALVILAAATAAAPSIRIRFALAAAAARSGYEAASSERQRRCRRRKDRAAVLRDRFRHGQCRHHRGCRLRLRRGKERRNHQFYVCSVNCESIEFARA